MYHILYYVTVHCGKKYISKSVPYFVPLWYIAAQIYISKSDSYFLPYCGTLWYKYTLEKVGTSAKVGALEEENSAILLWYIMVQIYISKSVPYFIPCFAPYHDTLSYKYTLVKVYHTFYHVMVH